MQAAPLLDDPAARRVFAGRKRWTMVTLAAGALAAVIATTAFVRARRGHQADVVAAANAPASRFGAEGRLGEQMTYDLAFTISLSQGGPGRPIEMNLAGRWQTTVVAVRADGYDVACQITGVRVTGGGEVAATEATEGLRARLGRRFWVTYRDDGAALRVHFPKDLSPGDRNLLQMIPAETQLVVPRHVAPQWTALERDGAGLYLAAYQRSDPDHVRKRKLKYTDVEATAAAPGAVSVDFDTSERRYTLDPTGRILAFAGQDRLHVAIALGDARPLGVSTSTRLDAGRTGRAPDLIGSLAASRPQLDDVPLRTHEVDPHVLEREQDLRLLGGRPTDALLDEAAAARNDAPLRARLAALFRTRPEAITLAAARLRGATGAGGTMVAGLALAGTPAALQALTQLAHDARVATALRVDALSALGFVPRPTQLAMSAPLGLLDDADPKLRQAARLVAGALARAGRSGVPAREAEAEALDRALIERYHSVTGIADQKELLAALGNSGGPAVLPLLATALSHPRADVRATAARSLRLPGGAQVEQQLQTAIASDPDPGVRTAALFAVGFHPFAAFVPSIVRAATDDASEFVRADAIGLLKQHLADLPELRDTLAHAAAHDPTPGVRRLAKQALLEGRR